MTQRIDLATKKKPVREFVLVQPELEDRRFGLADKK